MNVVKANTGDLTSAMRALGRAARTAATTLAMAERAAKEPREFAVDDQAELYARVKQSVAEELGRAYSITGKAERHDAVDAAKAKVKAPVTGDVNDHSSSGGTTEAAKAAKQAKAPGM